MLWSRRRANSLEPEGAAPVRAWRRGWPGVISPADIGRPAAARKGVSRASGLIRFNLEPRFGSFRLKYEKHLAIQ
jgi:hypothetical protein